MDVTTTPAGLAVVRLTGELNAVTSPALKRTLNELAAAGNARIVVNLAEVPFIDSSGLGALVSGLKATKLAEGTLLLAGLQEQARTIFEITMAYRLFDIVPSVEAAEHALAEA